MLPDRFEHYMCFCRRSLVIISSVAPLQLDLKLSLDRLESLAIFVGWNLWLYLQSANPSDLLDSSVLGFIIMCFLLEAEVDS